MVNIKKLSNQSVGCRLKFAEIQNKFEHEFKFTVKNNAVGNLEQCNQQVT